MTISSSTNTYLWSNVLIIYDNRTAGPVTHIYQTLTAVCLGLRSRAGGGSGGVGEGGMSPTWGAEIVLGHGEGFVLHCRFLCPLEGRRRGISSEIISDSPL